MIRTSSLRLIGSAPALLLAALWVILSSIPVSADVHPEQDNRPKALTGSAFHPRLGEYHYEIVWGKSRVATGIISIQREGDFYVLKADQQTTKFIDRIYRVRYRGETHISAADLSPTASVIEEQIKKETKVQTAEYDAQTGAVKVEEKSSGRKEPEVRTKTYELSSDTGIVDVFSATFLARSFDWKVGKEHQFMVFTGEKQYHVTMDCIGKSTYELDGHIIPVWVIQPGIRKTTKTEPYRVHEKTRIYIAADESKDIVKIKSQPGIGTVKLRLVKYIEK